MLGSSQMNLHVISDTVKLPGTSTPEKEKKNKTTIILSC